MIRPPGGSCDFIILESLLQAPEGAGQVHGDNAIPLVRRQVFERDRRRVQAGIVEEQIQPPEAVLDRGEKTDDRLVIAYIGGQDQGAVIADISQGDCLAQGVFAPAGKRQRPAFFP